MEQVHIAANSESAKRNPRMRFSPEASERLMAIYMSGISKPNKQLREELALDLNKTPRSIQIWFQNRRAKAKVNASKGDYSPNGDSEENENFPLDHSKSNLSKLNMNAVESLASPRSAKLNRSPLKSPYTGPKSAYAFSARHDPYPYPISPKQRMAESQSPPHHYQQQKVIDTSRFSPYPSPLDSHSPHSKNFYSQHGDSAGHQQPYSRFAKEEMKLEMNNLNGYTDGFNENVPQSAFEMRGQESSFNFSELPPTSNYLPGLSNKDNYRDNYNAPHSAMPYSTNAFTFPDIPGTQSPQIFSAPARSSSESSSYKGTALPDLNEIAADPAKFMQWISTSR